jgi:hypothetical protein
MQRIRLFLKGDSMWGGRIPVVSPYPRSMNTATDYVITIDVGEQVIQSAIIMYVHTAGLN